MLIISFVSSSVQQSSSWKWKHMHESHAKKCPKAGRNLFKPYLQKNQALHPYDQGRFSPEILPKALGLWSGRRDRATFQATCGHREIKPHQTQLKAHKPWQKPWHRDNSRVGISQMATKGTRANCQKLKTNLSLLEPHISQHCHKMERCKLQAHTKW